MIALNLVPLPRLERNRRARQAVRWRWVCGLYAGTAAAIVGGLALGWRTDVASVAARLEAAEAGNAERQRGITASTMGLGALNKTLAANRAVGDQPDWSVLLAVVARSMGEDMAMRRCAVSLSAEKPPEPPAGGAAPAKSPHHPARAVYLLRASFIAPSLTMASRLALDLEHTRLFDRVELASSRRETVLDSDAIAFEIECRLGGAGAQP